MIDFNIYPSCILPKHRVDSWQTISGLEDLPGELVQTRDRNLLQVIVQHDPDAQQAAWRRIAGNDCMMMPMFHVHVWHSGKLHIGCVIELVDLDYCANVVHPNAAGNRQDQDDALSTVTVAAPKRLIGNIGRDWTERLQRLAATQSRMRTSRTQPAVQIQMHEHEFSFADNVDLMIATLYAIQFVRSAQLVLGRSLTSVNAVGQKPITEPVDTLFGPFSVVEE